MRVSDSPDFLESVANHPRVYPYVRSDADGPIRFGAAWADCIGLEWDEGGFLFCRRDPTTYEVHTLFLPKTRDVDAKAEEALAYVFGLGADAILTQVARDLPHVRRFAERHGFRRFDEGPWRDGVADYYVLTQQEWQGCQSQPLPQS